MASDDRDHFCCAEVELVRAKYERATGLDTVLRRVEELSARTVVFDIEPLVAYWDSGQDELERGVVQIVLRVSELPKVQLVCFSTNSTRRPRAMPASAGVRVVYLASASKPMRLTPYRDFPRPGLVVGDQIATDGLLARRLGYAFVQYRPTLEEIPAGPRLLSQLGRLVRPVAFSRPSRSLRHGHGPLAACPHSGGRGTGVVLAISRPAWHLVLHGCPADDSPCAGRDIARPGCAASIGTAVTFRCLATGREGNQITDQA